MMKFGKTEIAKEKFYAAKKPIKIWDVNVNNIKISNFGTQQQILLQIYLGNCAFKVVNKRRLNIINAVL